MSFPYCTLLTCGLCTYTFNPLPAGMDGEVGQCGKGKSLSVSFVDTFTSVNMGKPAAQIMK